MSKKSRKNFLKCFDLGQPPYLSLEHEQTKSEKFLSKFRLGSTPSPPMENVKIKQENSFLKHLNLDKFQREAYWFRACFVFHVVHTFGYIEGIF